MFVIVRYMTADKQYPLFWRENKKSQGEWVGDLNQATEYYWSWAHEVMDHKTGFKPCNSDDHCKVMRKCLDGRLE